jgi:transposase
MGMPRFVNIDRATALLLPQDMREWVPADDVVHLVIEAVEQMDLALVEVNERGTGSAQFPPGMLLALLIYCYSQEIYSSRRIERATHTHIAVRFLTGDTHPDHDTVATFRKRNGALLRQAFREVLQLARQVGVLRLGTVFLDGTKIKANASRRANRPEAQLRAEVAELDAEISRRLAGADAADATDVAEQLPKELTHAATRRAKLAAARSALQQRAKEQGRPPDDDDLGNTSDPDSRPQKTRHGCIQGYNAQLATSENGLIVAAHVCRENQDRRQLVPTMQQVMEVDRPHTVVADTGYDSHEQIKSVEQTTGASIYIPPQLPVEVHTRQSRADAARSAERARRLERVRSPIGQRLLRQRQTTVEPVFGIIKAARRFDCFLLRGLAQVEAEWVLLCTAFNLRRIHRLLAQTA